MSDQTIHKQLSVNYFNEVWNLLDKADRTPEEDRLMRETAHASLFHWLQRDDCEDGNLSIGLWQISRVHSVLGDGGTALRYARECIDISEKLPPFYLGYAYEAAARAARLLGDDEFAGFFKKAREQMTLVEEEDNRKLLEVDLNELDEN